MAPTDRTTVVLRSLTDFTGATYLGANLDIHAYGVRSTQWSDFTTPRTDRPVRFHPRPHFWRKLCFAPLSRITRQ